MKSLIMSEETLDFCDKLDARPVAVCGPFEPPKRCAVSTNKDEAFLNPFGPLAGEGRENELVSLTRTDC